MRADEVRRRHCADVAVTSSLGERPDDDLRAFRDVGASRYLMKHETMNPDLYARMRPGLRLTDRLRTIETLRGLGRIPGSGLEFADEFEDVDAKRRYGLSIEECPPLPGCTCGEVLRGRLRPDQCPLFKKACTPAKPQTPRPPVDVIRR